MTDSTPAMQEARLVDSLFLQPFLCKQIGLSALWYEEGFSPIGTCSMQYSLIIKSSQLPAADQAQAVLCAFGLATIADGFSNAAECPPVCMHCIMHPCTG